MPPQSNAIHYPVTITLSDRETSDSRTFTWSVYNAEQEYVRPVILETDGESRLLFTLDSSGAISWSTEDVMYVRLNRQPESEVLVRLWIGELDDLGGEEVDQDSPFILGAGSDTPGKVLDLVFTPDDWDVTREIKVTLEGVVSSAVSSARIRARAYLVGGQLIPAGMFASQAFAQQVREGSIDNTLQKTASKVAMAGDKTGIHRRLRDNPLGRHAAIRRALQAILVDAQNDGKLRPNASGFWETAVRDGNNGWDSLSSLTDEDLKKAGELIKQGFEQADPGKIQKVQVFNLRFRLSWWGAQDKGQNRWVVKYGRYIVADIIFLHQQADGTWIRRKGTVHFNFEDEEYAADITLMGIQR